MVRLRGCWHSPGTVLRRELKDHTGRAYSSRNFGYDDPRARAKALALTERFAFALKVQWTPARHGHPPRYR
jgi:hypothetical protein